MKSYLTWHGISDWSWLAMCGGAVAIAAVLVIVLYRYERHLISRSLGWTLLLLRLATIGLIFLAFLEPVRITEIDKERTGRILVAVDVSESMDTIDSHATPAEKLRWARALGMIGNDQINDRLDGWQTALDAGEEPEWVSATEEPNAARREQLTQVRRENLDTVFTQLGELSRREIARRLLTAGQSPVLGKLGELGLLEVSLFAGSHASIDPQQTSERLDQPLVEVQAGVTDLGQPVAPDTDGQQDIPVAGIVVLSDGRHNASVSENRLIAQLSGVAAPIYPVLIGSEERPRDLAFGSLDYPRQPVSQDDHPLVTAQLRTTGFEGRDLTITLTPQDGAPGEVQTETVRVTGPTTEVQFRLDAPTLGRHRYTVSTEVQPGETRDDNNSRNFTVTVVDDEADVLLVEGEARWEFRYLDNALRRDEQVEVQEILFRQPYMGVLPDPFFPRKLDLPADPQRLQDSPFAPFDVVILGDVGPRQMPAGGWELLDRFVREEGGTLVIQGGPRHMPLGYSREPILEALLPVTELKTINLTGRNEEAPPLERGFRLTLTPDGRDEPFLKFSDDIQEDTRIRSELPGHTWGLVGEARGEATVLASYLPPGTEQTLESERENAVIVRQQVGFGQVLWIGIDSTWRWRHRRGDEYHHRFWGQLVRWGARFKALSKNEFVAFGPVEPAIEAGQVGTFRAAWSRNFLDRFPNLRARGVVSRLDDQQHIPIQTFDMLPGGSGPLDYEGQVLGLPPGEYRVELQVDSADLGAEKVIAELQIQEPATSELSDISANRALLETMAEFTDGRMLLPHEVARLPEEFRSVTESTTLRSEQSLWNSWPFLLLFFAMLTTEWVLRKLNGLP
ncbi:MAG: hypothetical protein R3B90_22305 [Planctomycetaceae bacterium]